MIEKLKRTAFHESGHVAACIALRVKMALATIDRTIVTDRDGWEVYAGLTQVNLGEPVATAIVCLAGPAASKRLSPGDNQIGMEGDLRSADKAIDAATGDHRSFANLSGYACRRADITFRVRAAAEQIVEHHWPEIVAIASALLERQTITGDDAAQLFERSLRARGARVWALGEMVPSGGPL